MAEKLPGVSGAELEQRFYRFADAVIRLAHQDEAEREKTLKTVYGRHVAYVLSLLNGMAKAGEFDDWQELKPTPALEQQVLNRAKQHTAERQAKQLYR